MHQKTVFYVNVWSGTKRFNTSHLIDELGSTFPIPEFAKKIGINSSTAFIGGKFPESVALTKDFKLRNYQVNYECMCLCKTIDVYLWKGFNWKLNFRTIAGPAVMSRPIQLLMKEKSSKKILYAILALLLLSTILNAGFALKLKLKLQRKNDTSAARRNDSGHSRHGSKTSISRQSTEM